ncbi:MAG: hypothetical protein IJH25_16965 [Clostridia bacterium]|nr:hypothetical protein [Clostridia bacterium]MBQ6326403.1 hypothetical protein [Clostridia bacterium]
MEEQIPPPIVAIGKPDGENLITGAAGGQRGHCRGKEGRSACRRIR